MDWAEAVGAARVARRTRTGGRGSAARSGAAKAKAGGKKSAQAKTCGWTKKDDTARSGRAATIRRAPDAHGDAFRARARARARVRNNGRASHRGARAQARKDASPPR